MHIQRYWDGIAVVQLPEGKLRDLLKRKIPPSHRKELRLLNGFFLNPSEEKTLRDCFQQLGQVFPPCKKCWEKPPCKEWKDEVERQIYQEFPGRSFRKEKESNTKETWHLLKAIDASESISWLIRLDDVPPYAGDLIEKAAHPFYWFDDSIDAWSISDSAIRRVREKLEKSFSGFEWCKRCLSGHPCGVWISYLLEWEGYRGFAEPDHSSEYRSQSTWSFRENERVSSFVDPKEEAAKVLGVKPSATEKEIKKAFKDLALQRHPDHGGTDAQMKKLLKARDMLLKK